MKKMISFVLVLMMITALMVPVYAADGPTIASVSGGTAAPGQDITVTVSISNNSAGIMGGNVTLSYDKSVMTLKSMTPGYFSTVNPATGFANGAYAVPMTSEGALVTAVFTISDSAKNGNNTISISGTYRDAAGAKQSYSASNTITVKVPECANHTWGAWSDNQPTCAEGAVQTRTCTVCEKVETRTVPATGNHTAGAAVKENEKAATCGAAGSYDEVVYCTVCNAEMSRNTTTVPATGAHVAGAVVKENEKAATCGAAGSHDDVTYCTGCGKEMSRKTVTDPATGAHVAGKVVKENEKAATCGAAGSHDDVTYCTGCGKEMSRNKVTDPATGKHVEEVRGEIKATCNKDGYSGDTYCKDCGEKLATGNVIPATGKHVEEVRGAIEATCNKEGYTGDTYCKDCNTKIKDGNAIPATGKHVEEVRGAKAATCTEDGYTGDTYCKDCNTKIKDGTVIPATGHQNTEIRDAKVATCKTEGYTGDTYCKDCGEKLATGNVTPIDPDNHTPAAAVRENEVKGTCKTKHSYDSVVYCSGCKVEISRKNIVGELGGHEYGTNGKCTCCGKVKDPDLDNQPDTGDIFVEIAMYAAFAALAVGAVVVARRKARG